MRIGVNIPYALHRRLEPLKQYINISQICREAIEDRIRCYEKALASPGDKDVVRAVEETWAEEKVMRDIINVDWGTLGCEDAKAWVTKAPLEAWKYLHHRQDVIRRQERPRWEVPPPNLEEVKTFDERFAELQQLVRQQDDRFFDWLYEEYDRLDSDRALREYMSAWLAYTDSVWDLFCQKRREHMEESGKELLRPDEKRQRPTIPPNLLSELGALRGIVKN